MKTKIRFAWPMILPLLLAACGEALPESGVDADSATGVVDTDAATADTAAPRYVFQASTAAPFFVDDFERADGAVGNGWRDGVAGSFALDAGDAVCVVGVGPRPAKASLVRDVGPPDVEACVVMRFATEDEVAIFLRGSASDSYRVALSAARLSLVRVIQSTSSQTSVEGGYGFLNALPAGRYTLCLRVSGADAISIEGAVYDSSKPDAPLYSARMTDEDAGRLKAPGYVGLAAKLPGASYVEKIELR